MTENLILVDVDAYLDDLYEYIPETDRKMIAEEIARKFDYTCIYDRLDQWVSVISEENNIKLEEENDSN